MESEKDLDYESDGIIPAVIDKREKKRLQDLIQVVLCYLDLENSQTIEQERYADICFRMSKLFGKPPSLEKLRSTPEKIGKLFIALCREFCPILLENSLSFRIVLRKKLYESHFFFKENLETILPLFSGDVL